MPGVSCHNTGLKFSSWKSGSSMFAVNIIDMLIEFRKLQNPFKIPVKSPNLFLLLQALPGSAVKLTP